MSGHSKWANIKRKKESVDSKKAQIFSKIGKELTIAVKIGGSTDPQANSRLRDVIAKAKSNNMPNDNIMRCIQKAAGEGSTNTYEEITYEGFGPCGVSVMVDVLTDNKNRAAADIRCIFDRSGGSLGQTGSVGYMFSKKGYILLERTSEIVEDDLMLEVLDLGAEDFSSDEEYIEIITSPENFSKVREYIESKNYVIAESQIKMIASMKKDLTEEEEDKFQTFLDKLDNNEDVQDVWHNADI